MFIISPSFTLVLVLFLGTAIDSSLLFLLNFINPEAPTQNGMMETRSYFPFPFSIDHTHGLGGRTLKHIKSPFTPKENWRKWRFRSGPMKKQMVQPGLEDKDKDKGFKNLMVGGLGGLGGWFLKKSNPSNTEYPVVKDQSVKQVKFPASAGFGLSYGRG